MCCEVKAKGYKKLFFLSKQKKSNKCSLSLKKYSSSKNSFHIKKGLQNGKKLELRPAAKQKKSFLQKKKMFFRKASKSCSENLFFENFERSLVIFSLSDVPGTPRVKFFVKKIRKNFTAKLSVKKFEKILLGLAHQNLGFRCFYAVGSDTVAQ